ncbi:uncharacterized protein LOC134537042 isoform X2 [Bacillus rossius redtenbacheri]|uniref:uncharacterized protein LOC134537042 isoform X2 n=1 Tax=Bacillus rossius redtenbacheri TaxID=93214 RepID=UPI002FDE12A6
MCTAVILAAVATVASVLVASAHGTRIDTGLTNVDEMRYELMDLVHDLWDDVKDPRWVALANDSLGGADIELLRAFQTLGDKVEQRSPRTGQYTELGSLWAWARADAELRRIRALYDSFRRFQEQQTRPDVLPSSRRAWTDLAETILQDSTSSVPQSLSRLHDLIANPVGAGGDLFQQALKESASNVCNMPQSAQQLLYNLYTSVALTELKGYAMMQFSWMLLKLYDKGNFTLEAQMMRDRYEVRTEQKVAAVKAAMRAAGRELRRCDPKHHVEGETYVQLTQLLQGHVQNEVDMSTESTCRENCAYYSYAKSHGCYQNQFCSQQPRCNGRLIDCRFIDSDMWVCQADKASDRRYSWIEYENGRVLGQKGTCSRGTTKVDSWWRWLFWHCSYCFCLCDEQGPKSDRYFNLRPVAADVENNMVVTGLRFVKDNRVIHLQIQEGALLPHGEINETSLSWRPVDDYRISDSDVHNGEDYHTLSWEQRAIDIDDLMVPAGHVLTGVRFRRVGTHMNLEIMATPINFTEGILIQPKEKSLWHANDNTDASLVTPRKRIDLENPDVPTRSYASQPDSKPDQFLLFTHSDVDADAAQTTVPFLDAQPVSSNPPTLLAGAGIYHKGQRGYGGFVAPKVFTYDYAPHISAKFPSDQRYHNRRK